ncbi:hypothetical protein [Devosia psychrophila]|jgi:hypothetical protein|uniref:Addiction module component n=1 Tax=Devosia psychrophila TaxID=728005 RepID=A0A0F5PXZ6_9HYPH|nr:hypothetical protein [Devosia psychrophila]KKC32689.1 hypothetical protein WH91_12755 [Devosia psychrophila]SFC52388.1 hypothetical protein SAMN04488059_106106 [Devosia psychrophila]
MTTLLDEAIERARALPQRAQDDLARVVLQLTEAEQSIYQLSVDELAALAPSMIEADAGVYASDAQVAAVWAKHSQ